MLIANDPAGIPVANFDESARMGCGASSKPLVNDRPPDDRRTMSKPTLHYFDVNGRGELSKLIAAVGGLEIECVEVRGENSASLASGSRRAPTA